MNTPLSILVSTQFNFVYVVGDINCDFSRNTIHVKTIQDFWNKNNFYTLWTDHPVDFTYSFESENGDSYNKTLDHILTLTSSKHQIVNAGVLHLVENMSDHEPIYTIIKADHEDKNNLNKVKNETKPKPKWKNASSDQKLEYNDVLFQKLLNMNVPSDLLNCTDVNCNNPFHKEEIDLYVKEILEAVSDSGHQTIPSSSKSKSKHGSKAICGTLPRQGSLLTLSLAECG